MIQSFDCTVNENCAQVCSMSFFPTHFKHKSRNRDTLFCSKMSIESKIIVQFNSYKCVVLNLSLPFFSLNLIKLISPSNFGSASSEILVMVLCFEIQHELFNSHCFLIQNSLFLRGISLILGMGTNSIP